MLLAGTVASGFATDLAILHNGFSISHERRQVLGSITRLYLSSTDQSGYVDVPTSEIDRFEADVSPGAPKVASQNLPELVRITSSRYHLDPDLVNSVIHAESGFRKGAVSPKGAQGLMQLMPQTASRLGIANAFDPAANLDGGSRYLRQLLELYNFDLIKALAAYNAGPLRVQQYHGVPPYAETQAYVAKVVRDFNRKKVAEKKAATAKKAHRPATLGQASTPAPAAIPEVAQRTAR